MKKDTLNFKSENGSSLVLVLVFLLFCMFTGGAVLSAAAANSARAAQMRQERQTYLIQRSVLQTLSSFLEDTPQLTIKDVTTPSDRTVTCTVHPADGEISCLQELLYTYTVRRYAAQHNLPLTDLKFVNFRPEITTFRTEGTVDVTLEYYREGTLMEENHQADYLLSGEGELVLSLSQLHMTVPCTVGTGAPVTVTLEEESTTTVTTVIHWGAPEIGKGGNR